MIPNQGLYLRYFLACLLIASIFVSISTNAMAQTPWPSWRGPNGNGTALSGTYPTQWSEDKGIEWKLSLSGRGASTPIVLGDNLYLTYGKDGTNTLACINTAGKLVWEKSLNKEKPGKHAKASGSNSSPVTDGKNIFVYFKSGDFACVSPTGEVQWSLNIQVKYGEDSLWWDLGTSPVLTDKDVVITVMQTGPSFLVALDKNTGKEHWKADRQLNVREEANQSYTTPTLSKTKQGDALLTVGADHVTAHAASDGRLLWKLGGFNPKHDGYFRSIASPVAVEGLVFCPYARGSSLTAVRTDASLNENQRVAWSKDFGSDVPTPIVSQGMLYLLGDKGLITCMQLESGEVVWSEQLPKSSKPFSSSPIIANGRIYCVREDATTFVLSQGAEKPGELLSENKLDGNAVATPVFANNRIYIRTFEFLYCIQ